jgi:hypothetical protein
MGDMAERGRLPGAMKLASEGCGATKLDLYVHRSTSHAAQRSLQHLEAAAAVPGAVLLALWLTMIGDMADSGRLPGAMKLASEGCGVTKLDLHTSNTIRSCSITLVATFVSSSSSSCARGYEVGLSGVRRDKA